MQISKVYRNNFGLKFTNRAKAFFKNKYRHCCEKLLEVSILENKYPNNLVFDIKNDVNNSETFTCTLKRKGSNIFTETQFRNSQDLYEIENFIKAYLKFN